MLSALHIGLLKGALIALQKKEGITTEGGGTAVTGREEDSNAKKG